MNSRPWPPWSPAGSRTTAWPRRWSTAATSTAPSSGPLAPPTPGPERRFRRRPPAGSRWVDLRTEVPESAAGVEDRVEVAGDPVLVDLLGDGGGDRLDRAQGVAHGDPVPGPRQHLDVIGHIPERHHLRPGHAEVLAQVRQRLRLRDPGRGELDEPVVRFGERGMAGALDERVDEVVHRLRIARVQSYEHLHDLLAAQL